MKMLPPEAVAFILSIVSLAGSLATIWITVSTRSFYDKQRLFDIERRVIKELNHYPVEECLMITNTIKYWGFDEELFESFCKQHYAKKEGPVRPDPSTPFVKS